MLSAVNPDIETCLAGRDDAVLVVRIPGDLTHDRATPVRIAVERGLPNRDGAAVVLDMSRVRLVTSLGVAALLQIQEFCADRRAPLRLVGLSERLVSFLGMLGLTTKFASCATLDDALAQLEM